MTRRPRPRRSPARPRRSPGRRDRRTHLAILVIALAAVAGGLFLVFGPGPAGPRGASVVLEPGSGVVAIGHALQRAKAVRSRWLFVAVAEVTGASHRLQAGEYLVPPGASVWRTVRLIEQGRVVRHFVTIPEGFTSAAAAQVLAAASELSGPVSTPEEGTLLPETYEVRRGETREAVLAQMQAAQRRLLGQLWAAREPGLPYRSPQEAVTLASIIEKETALPQERPRVAAVFLNRLGLGMRLGSDPTVIYGLTGGRPLGHGLTRSELASDTAYNTYLHGGLPPAPIDNPGRASLAAALDPAHTGDLYFVANGTGGHAFSANLADHDRNVAHWRQIERAGKGG